MTPIETSGRTRLPMPTNHYSLQVQIMNYIADVDFNEFLESNPSAKVFYEDLDKDQKEQYAEDFWYFYHLASQATQFLKNTQYPIHDL